MFTHVFLRNKHKKEKACFACIMFLLRIAKSNFLTKNNMLKSNCEILTCESIDACNLLRISHLHNPFAFFALSKSKYRNKDLFFKLLLLLSGDLILNSGLHNMDQPSNKNEWDVFKVRGRFFIQININSLLHEIEELRRIATQLS